MSINKKAQEQIAAKDDVSVKVTIDTSPAEFYRVKVTAESGIFKQGVQYDKGDEAVLELRAAQKFEKRGEVDILERVDDDDEGGEDAAADS